MREESELESKVHPGSKPEVSLPCSIMFGRCPCCRQGRLFVHRNPYTAREGLKMPDHCPVCQQDFQIEPGFYIGALWTSFPLVILVIAALALVLLGVLGIQPEWALAVILPVLLLLQPVIMRLGRSIWIHIFVRFEQISNS